MASKQEEESLSKCNRYQLASGYELTTCNCKHMRRLRVGEKHSIVNPQKWICSICYTTESVWACLSCPNVACGRYIQEHALYHYQESGHPIVIDVNELSVFCYKCDEYVLNDNNFSDIKVLRETLLAIRYQNFTGTTRSGHTLRSASIMEKEDVEMRKRLQQEQLDRDDRMFTAIWHSRFVRQRKAFKRWLQYVSICQKRDIFNYSSSSCEDDAEVFGTQDTTVSQFSNVSSEQEPEIKITPARNFALPVPIKLSNIIEDQNLIISSPEDKTEDLKKETFTTDVQHVPEEDVKVAKSIATKMKEEIKSVDMKTEPKTIPKTVDTVESQPVELNISSRPRRSTAARRYKEIFGKSQRHGQVSKPSKVDSALRKRRSERIKSLITKSKMIKKKANVKKTTKAQPKSTTLKRKVIQKPKIIKKKVVKAKQHNLYSSVQRRPVTSLIPGVTGLRNLGNTCYLNSIIQVLGHLQKFRLCLLALQELEDVGKSSPESQEWMTSQAAKSSTPTKNMSGRRTTIELYEAQSCVDENEFKMTRKSERLARIQPDGSLNSNKFYEEKWHSLQSLSTPSSLCNELHDLYRVMWSGKWKMVSPYHFLQSVWSLIPSFKGYSQQDAQEFLCELLDKIVNELEHNHYKRTVAENRLALRVLDVVHTVFEGQFTSQVRCLHCRHVSTKIEPFWDLSLEFPERFHRLEANKIRSKKKIKDQLQCNLLEMLEKFTASEVLEGGKVYGCSQCNNTTCNDGAAIKRRSSIRNNSTVFTEAEKQLKITELPQVLRFHLKRFRWGDRNHREKIAVHVNFPSELDMQPYCYRNESNTDIPMYLYDLSAVVIHHGRRFNAGHYTAYCWNEVGNFWVHCNDSNLELCSIEDVMASQAYILFYTQRGTDPSPHILSPPLTPIVRSPTRSTVASPEHPSTNDIDNKTYDVLKSLQPSHFFGNNFNSE